MQFMNLFFKFDVNKICKIVLHDILVAHNVQFESLRFGEINLLEKITEEDQHVLVKSLSLHGIEIIENQKSIVVQKIKEVIIDMVYNQDSEVNIKSSAYISDKVGQSYGYLSNLFSESTHTSIENFIILQKIEYTKQLIINEGLSLTEIAFKLNYSSVAHLSTQFKNTTGITPSAFQKIISRRREVITNI